MASSQCFGTSGRLALAPVADWLRHPAVMAAAAAIDPVWRTEVGGCCRPGGARNAKLAAGRWRIRGRGHRFFEGLARALMAVGGPTLLILDNMQWCDQERCRFITFSWAWPLRCPVLVVGTLA